MASEIDIRREVVAIFPALQQHPFELTSPKTPVYNCIAWAAGIDDRFMWPTLDWPRGISRKVTRASFIKMFAQLGYRQCETADPEDGFEKVALYEDKNGEPTHASRLLPNGRWTSKLGSNVDISHSLEGLIGGEYGSPVLYMRRPTGDDGTR